MSTARKSYTEEFKREAVRLAKERGNITAAARDLGVSDTSLENWKRQLEQKPENAFPGNGNPHDKQTAQLQRENARLKEENEILKKAVGIFTARPQ
jgi:transposase